MALETPLAGRFLKEGRILFFGPPPAYMRLCWATLGVGAGLILFGLVEQITQSGAPFYWGWVGVMVLGAGLWAFGSLQRITFDLRTNTYRRWHGPGFLPRLFTGALENLHSLVFMAEDRYLPTGRFVVYRLVLYWKNPREPLMVVQQQALTVPAGAPLNFAAQTLGAAGWDYAKALKVPWQDLTDRSLPCPIPVFA
jgi:hypothetical protein